MKYPRNWWQRIWDKALGYTWTMGIDHAIGSDEAYYIIGKMNRKGVFTVVEEGVLTTSPTGRKE